MNCTEVAPMEECTEESRRSVNIMKAPGSTDLCDHIVRQPLPFNTFFYCLFVYFDVLIMFTSISFIVTK